VEEGLRDECLKYGHQLMESAYVIFKEVGYKPAYLLIDLEGLSMYQVTHLESEEFLRPKRNVFECKD